MVNYKEFAKIKEALIAAYRQLISDKLTEDEILESLLELVSEKLSDLQTEVFQCAYRRVVKDFPRFDYEDVVKYCRGISFRRRVLEQRSPLSDDQVQKIEAAVASFVEQNKNTKGLVEVLKQAQIVPPAQFSSISKIVTNHFSKLMREAMERLASEALQAGFQDASALVEHIMTAFKQSFRLDSYTFYQDRLIQLLEGMPGLKIEY